MTKLTRYSEAFWGQEYTSTAGFDTLIRHNAEEKKFLSDFEDYLRKRSKMELEFSKSLGHLAKSMKERTGTGVMEAAWNCLRGEVDVCKQTHEEAGLFFTQHAEETKRFCKEITARRDSAEERVKKAQHQKHSQFKNVTSFCKTYGNKCREKDQLTEAFSVLKRGVTSTIKDIDKAKLKMEKSMEDALKAETQYRNAVVVLEETRKEWEREMAQACEEFQGSDEEQISFLRSEMWLAVNRTSQVALDVDESCERVRNILETCDVDQDIQTFIARATTGTQRPEPVVYQDYYESAGGTGGNNSRAMAPSPNTAQRQLPATPIADNHRSSDPYSLLDDDNDPLYSMADPVPDPCPRQLTVVRSFQSPPDFVVQAGEKVTFVRKVSPNVVQVRTLTSKTGNLPLTCIKESV